MFLNWRKTDGSEDHQSERQRHDRMCLEYDAALQQIDDLLVWVENNEERIAVLDYAIKVVKRDLIGEGLARIVYGKEVPEWRSDFPGPGHGAKRETISLDLAKTDVLVTPWATTRLPGAICDLLREPFDQRRDYYTATYYSEIELLVIGNGIHHTAVASIGKGGMLDGCIVVRWTPLFEEIGTDGAVWNYWKDGSVLPVSDFRLALLYTLAKMKHELR